MSSNTYAFVTQPAIDTLDAIRAIIKTAEVLSTREIGTAVGRGRSAISPYLRHLSARGEIHCVPGAGSALLWKNGPGSAVANVLDYDEEEDLIDPAPPRRKIEPAKQIGMWRDSLVAALFGEARAQVAL